MINNKVLDVLNEADYLFADEGYEPNSNIRTRIKEAINALNSNIIGFASWYSGMSEEKVLRAYERFLKENNEAKTT